MPGHTDRIRQLKNLHSPGPAARRLGVSIPKARPTVLLWEPVRKLRSR
jgi:hypothetical protein